MKKDIHPAYHPVVFVDANANTEFVTRSTKRSSETRVIDGVEHFVLRVEISAASHPFYTGKQKFVDTAGRIEKFQKKYAGKYGTAKNEADKAAADAAAAARPPAPKPAPKPKAPKPPKAAKPADGTSADAKGPGRGDGAKAGSDAGAAGSARPTSPG